MRYFKTLLLASYLTSLPIQAETIEVIGSVGVAGAANTVAKACVKGALIKRNSGTLITNTPTASVKVKPYRITETSFTLLGQEVVKNFPVTFSLDSISRPGSSGGI